MLIRKALIQDLESVQKLNSDLFKHDFELDPTLDLDWPSSEEGRKYFEKSIISEDSTTVVADNNGKIVGYMIAALTETPVYIRKDIRMIEVENTFIQEEFRRQSLGTQMYEEIKSWAKGKGANMVMVTASYNNEKAKNFYKKMGLAETDLTFQQEI